MPRARCEKVFAFGLKLDAVFAAQAGNGHLAFNALNQFVGNACHKVWKIASSLIALPMYGYYTTRMQGFFSLPIYDSRMTAKKNESPLRALREAAGISLRELARQIGEDHSNVRFWETTGKIPRSDVLIPMAKALGVTVEELLGEPKAKRSSTPGGKVGQMFDAVSKLPRRQQQKIIEVVEALVSQHTGRAA